MGLTVSNKEFDIIGTKAVAYCNIAFDDSYAYGGEELKPSIAGRLSAAERVIIQPKKGHAFEYDLVNKKVKVFAPAPAIVYDEKHTIADDQITLDYPAAFIISVQAGTAGIRMTDAGATLASGECSFTPEEGVRTVITFYTGTTGTAYVTYITQAWKEVWDNVVTAEDVTVTTHIGALANNAVAIQSVRAKTGDIPFNCAKFLRVGDSAGATEEVVADFTPGAGNTNLTFYATDNISAAVISYVKMPASGFLADRFIEDEDVTISGEAGTTAYPILLPSLAGGIPDYTAAAEGDPYYMMMYSGDAVGTAGECKFDWRVRTATGTKITVNSGAASDAVSMCYVHGHPDEIPGLVPLEVKNGTDLSDLTGVEVMMIGRQKIGTFGVFWMCLF